MSPGYRGAPILTVRPTCARGGGVHRRELRPAGPRGEHRRRALTLEREVAAIRALVEEVGGTAALWGASSGGAIALAAAATGVPVSHLVLWEVPLDREGGSLFGDLDVPVLLLHGDPPMPPFAESAAALAAVLPDARIAALPGIGHQDGPDLDLAAMLPVATGFLRG